MCFVCVSLWLYVYICDDGKYVCVCVLRATHASEFIFVWFTMYFRGIPIHSRVHFGLVYWLVICSLLKQIHSYRFELNGSQIFGWNDNNNNNNRSSSTASNIHSINIRDGMIILTIEIENRILKHYDTYYLRFGYSFLFPLVIAMQRYSIWTERKKQKATSTAYVHFTYCIPV